MIKPYWISPTCLPKTNFPTYPVTNIEMRQKACPIDFSDPLLELVPENYLDQSPPSMQEIQEGVEDIVRESVAFLIRTRRESELQSKGTKNTNERSD